MKFFLKFFKNKIVFEILLFSLIIFLIFSFFERTNFFLGNSKKEIRFYTIVFFSFFWIFFRWIPKILTFYKNRRIFQNSNFLKNTEFIEKKKKQKIQEKIKKIIVYFYKEEFLFKKIFVKIFFKFLNFNKVNRFTWFFLINQGNCQIKDTIRQIFSKSYKFQAQKKEILKNNLYYYWYFKKCGLSLINFDFFSFSQKNFKKNRILKKILDIKNTIEGIIFSFDIPELLEDKMDFRSIKIVNKTILSLQKKIKKNVFIYFIFTNFHSINGFYEYFKFFDKEELQKCFGIKFKCIDFSEKKDRISFLNELQNRISILQYSINERLVLFLKKEKDLSKKFLLINFAKNFSFFCKKIFYLFESFFSFLYKEKKPIFIRGIFFTSKKERFLFKKESIFSKEEIIKENSITFDQKNIFLTKVDVFGSFLDFIFEDSKKNNKNTEKKLNFFSIFKYLSYLFIVLCISFLCWKAYVKNNFILHKTQEKFFEVYETSSYFYKNSENAKPINLSYFLEYIGKIKKISLIEDRNIGFIPWIYQICTNQKNKIYFSVQKLYIKSLQDVLWPIISQYITNLLICSDPNNFENTYDCFSAYQMIYKKDYYNKNFLKHHIYANFSEFPGIQELNDIEKKELKECIKDLINSGPLLSPYEKDNFLEKVKKEYIENIPFSERVYRKIKKEVSKIENLKKTTFSEIFGKTGSMLFQIRDRNNEEYVPTIFTSDGYWLGFNKILYIQIEKLIQEDHWVLEKNLHKEEISSLVNNVKHLYINDFIKFWENLINKISFRKFENIYQAIEICEILSRSDSPLKIFISNISEILSLSISESIKTEFLKEKNQILEKLRIFSEKFRGFYLSESKEIHPENILKNHFYNIINFSEINSNSKKNFDNFLLSIKKLCKYLFFIKENKSFNENEEILKEVSSEILFLPKPVKNISENVFHTCKNLVREQVLKNIEEKFHTEIFNFYEKNFKNKYPFFEDQSEVDLHCFCDMFIPEIGIADQFFQENLKNKIFFSETCAKFSEEYKIFEEKFKKILDFFSFVKYIQKVYFEEDRRNFSFSFFIKPFYMSKKILSLQIEIGEKKIIYNHGLEKKFLFSWKKEKEMQKINFRILLENGKSEHITEYGPWSVQKVFLKNILFQSKNKKQFFSKIYGDAIILKIIPEKHLYSPFYLPNLQKIME